MDEYWIGSHAYYLFYALCIYVGYKLYKPKKSKIGKKNKNEFSIQPNKSNQIKEDTSNSNWMNEAQRKEFEALAKK